MEQHNDWRLTGQERFLLGVTLHWSQWAPPGDNPAWDHDHCDFCWKKFVGSGSPESAEIEREGYTTDDRKHWICSECFEDFKDRFQWKVAFAH